MPTMGRYRIITHIPDYCDKDKGNFVIKKWDEPFVDRSGNHMMLTKVIYKDKKQKEHEQVIRVVHIHDY